MYVFNQVDVLFRPSECAFLTKYTGLLCTPNFTCRCPFCETTQVNFAVFNSIAKAVAGRTEDFTDRVLCKFFLLFFFILSQCFSATKHSEIKNIHTWGKVPSLAFIAKLTLTWLRYTLFIL